MRWVSEEEQSRELDERIDAFERELSEADALADEGLRAMEAGL
jgi:hypothetical protein